MNNATIINLVPDRVSLSTSNFHENSECSFYKRVLQHFPGNVNTVVYKKARHFKLVSTTVISCIFGLFFLLMVIVRNLVFFISPHKPIPQLQVSTILCKLEKKYKLTLPRVCYAICVYIILLFSTREI